MTDHAHELRRHARKIGRPAGDVPAVMTRDDVIRMARESGMLIPSFRIGGGLALGTCTVPDFERFAALVAAAERTACARHFEVAMRNAVTAEREACAKLCEKLGGMSSNWHAEAIRARGDA